MSFLTGSPRQPDELTWAASSHTHSPSPLPPSLLISPSLPLLRVNVLDVNEFSPVFEMQEYTASVLENQPSPVFVIQVSTCSTRHCSLSLLYLFPPSPHSSLPHLTPSSPPSHSSLPLHFPLPHLPSPKVNATEPESAGVSGSIQYQIVTGSGADFSLDSVTGVLTTTRPLDREQVVRYVLTIQASDSGGDASRTGYAQVSL